MEYHEPIQVLVSASHPVVWQSIAHVLRSHESFDVRGCSLQELDTSYLTPIDIILSVIDPAASALGNLDELFANLLNAFPKAKLVCIFLGESDPAVFSALRAGASGVIAESGHACESELGEVISAIRRVAAGEFVMSPSLAIHLAQLRATEVMSARGLNDDSLTDRESEVLRLLAEGRTNRQIASCLSLSEHTVRSHLRGIMQKLRVTNRVQAAALAWSGGLQQRIGTRGEQ